MTDTERLELIRQPYARYLPGGTLELKPHVEVGITLGDLAWLLERAGTGLEPAPHVEVAS